MHDIDRTQQEFSQELENYEHEQYEYGETEWSGETGVFSEAQAMELAAELLEVSSEAELDRFLGDLIKKAGQTVGQFVKSPVGQQLGGLLKGAAKKALPMVGSAIGSYFGGDSGAKIGSQVASTAGRIFGLELEGLSQEDQEYEAAKSFVHFAGAAAKNAASAPQKGHPKAIAQRAATAAARQHAPGLIAIAVAPKAATSGKICSGCGRPLAPDYFTGTVAAPPTATVGKPFAVGERGSSGTWYRRDNKIVLIGA
jgi:hypothetical protein